MNPTSPVPRLSATVEPFAVSLAVTCAVGASGFFLPSSVQGTAVSAIFLVATWIFVWRRSDEVVEGHGLALGGLVLPGRVDVRRLVSDAARAGAWALFLALLTFVPYFFGWKLWWKDHLHPPFSLAIPLKDLANESLTQFLLVALPEEAFYRGYLQSRLDAAFPKRISVLGAPLGWGWVVAGAIFAAGHLVPQLNPARLAVFFPALAFGWLRARTGGIGAGLTFHALCNLFSLLLFRGYHVI